MKRSLTLILMLIAFFSTAVHADDFFCPLPDVNTTQIELLGEGVVKLSTTLDDYLLYDWRYRNTGSNTIINVTASSDNFRTISGLIPGQNYLFQLRVYCNGQWSEWSTSKAFTLPSVQDCGNPDLNKIEVQKLDANTVRLTYLDDDKDYYLWNFKADEQLVWVTVGSSTNNALLLVRLIEGSTYEYRVRVRCGDVWSVWSETGSFDIDEALSCPTPSANNVLESDITYNSARLSYLNNSYLSYDWRYRKLGATSWINLPFSTSAGYSVTGLEAGTIYEYQVQVRCNSGWSNWSGSGLFITSEAPQCSGPNASQLSVSQLSTSSVRVTAPTSYLSYQYRLRTKGSSFWFSFAPSGNNQRTFTGLTPGQTYEYSLRVRCTDGTDSNWIPTQEFTLSSNTPNCTTPLLTDISVTNTSLNSAVLTYVPNDQFYYLWQYRVSGNSNWFFGGGSYSNSILLDGLAENTTYEYRLRVWCQNNGWSDYSAGGEFSTLQSVPDCADPVQSDITQLILGDDARRLAYIPDNKDYYRWRYRKQGTTSWTLSPSSTDNELGLSGLLPGTTYEYQLQVFCNGSWSNFAADGIFTTDPCPDADVSLITVSALTASSVRLTYAQSDKSAYRFSYRILGSGQSYTTIVTNNNYVDISGLTEGTTYQYVVRINCGSGYTAVSGSSTFTTTSGCANPSINNTTASNISSSSATFTYNPDDYSRYDWRYRPLGSSSWINQAAGSANQRTFSGLLAGTTYEYQVRTDCGNGNFSSWSGSAYFTTLSVSCSPPATTTFTADQIGLSSARLVYLLNDKTAYDWQYRPQGSNTWLDVNLNNSTTRTLSGLTAGTTYQYRLRVYCNGVWSAYSSTKTFTTQSVALLPNMTYNNPGSFTADDYTITFNNVVITNTGAAASPETHLGFYLSTDSNIQVSDRLIALNTIPALAPGATSTESITVNFAFTGIPAGTYYVGFVVDQGLMVTESNEADNTYRYANTVIVPDPNGSCSYPDNISLEGFDNSHFRFSWDAQAGVSSYQIRYRESGAANWTFLDDWGGTSHVSSLRTPCTTFEWQIRSACSGGGYSSWSPVQTVTTTGCDDTYCGSYGLAFNEWIQRLRIGNQFHTSGKNYGYGNYTNLTAQVQQGQTINFTITPGTDDETRDQVYGRAWIDFNGDDDFNDPGELVFSATGFDDTNLSGTINIPLSASIGATRLRVSLSTDSLLPPCTTGGYFETLDYSLLIQSAPSLRSAPQATDVAQTIAPALSELQELKETQAKDTWKTNSFNHNPTYSPQGDNLHLQVFPNPTHGHVTARLSQVLQAESRLQLFDPYGRLLKTYTYQAGRQPDETISLDGLPDGMYILRLQSGELQLSERVLLAH